MSELYLAHHGVEGQKWGVRNGPPYPLDEKSRIKNIKRIYNRNHSAYDFDLRTQFIKITEKTDLGQKIRNVIQSAGMLRDALYKSHPELIGDDLDNLSTFIDRYPNLPEVGVLLKAERDYNESAAAVIRQLIGTPYDYTNKITPEEYARAEYKAKIYLKDAANHFAFA